MAANARGYWGFLLGLASHLKHVKPPLCLIARVELHYLEAKIQQI